MGLNSISEMLHQSERRGYTETRRKVIRRNSNYVNVLKKEKKKTYSTLCDCLRILFKVDTD